MRRMLGSAGFTQTMQVTAGLLGTACFVLVPAISFPLACVAAIVFVLVVRVSCSSPPALLCLRPQLATPAQQLTTAIARIDPASPPCLHCSEYLPARTAPSAPCSP